MTSPQSTASRLHRPRIDEEHVYHARLPPGGSTGLAGVSTLPSRVAPPVGRHQLPQGSSTYLLGVTLTTSEGLVVW